MRRIAAILLLALLCLGAPDASAQTKRELDKWFSPMCRQLNELLEGRSTMTGKVSVERVSVKNGKTLMIYFSRYMSDCAIRYEDLEKINSIISSKMPENYRSYRHNYEAFANGTPLDVLVGRNASGMRPNDAARSNAYKAADVPLVRNISRNRTSPKGLDGRHIALWQSHGYYYDQKTCTWKWQRPRLFESVEDLYTQSYVLPYLVPMLENAGAVVMLPRERDVQTRELIVDNDTNSRNGSYSELSRKHHWKNAEQPGFAATREVYLEQENPFTEGTARIVESIAEDDATSVATWTPDIRQEGEYAVYVSYITTDGSTDNARYTVTHNGGSSTFRVNQTMGGSTWIYLGTFGFSPSARDQGVTLTNVTGRDGEIVSADAVKFGGGMGNIARKPYPKDEDGKPRRLAFDPSSEISGYPRWCEGARCWLQWAGMNDTIYSVTRFTDDYRDDYTCRARWVNALLGGSNRNPGEPGYRIPLDLSFAFHTDAGITKNDSIVGTLAIYTRISDGEEKYPHGGSRDIGREYADMVQTQVVSDIRATLEPDWNRRSIWDRSYYESRVPYVPAMLLELLSHQNFADMRLGLDPRFRFVASRAVYKGILKFLTYINECEYVVQPLPVTAFEAHISSGKAYLSWEPVTDPLEPTAGADSYIVYTRITDPKRAGMYSGDPELGLDGFDNGTPCSSNTFSAAIEPGKIYSFKVAAVNEGGESLCSEILSVGLAKGSDSAEVMVVNNFDRIAAPASFASCDSSMAGFANFIDGGVPYLRDISFTGDMFEFRRNASHLSSEYSEFGASNSDYETKVIAGNTFDFPLLHGAAIMNAGLSFVSCSREALLRGRVELQKYRICDLICGKQVRTPVGYEKREKETKSARRRMIEYSVFPSAIRDALFSFTKQGGSLLISGSYVLSDSNDFIYDFGTDEPILKKETESEKKFISDVLKCQWVTNKGGNAGDVRSVQSPYKFSSGRHYTFYTKPNSIRYCVESPDGFVPTNAAGAFTVMRYADSGISAAVAYKGPAYRVLTLGFPIESLATQSDINALMKDAVGFLK